MPKRLARLFALSGAILLIVLPAAASAAPQPWWQVISGSRPTNMWEATDNVQEIETHLAEFFGEEALAAKIEVEGKLVGCLATQNPVGNGVCAGTGFSPTSSAAELEALLEPVFGTSTLKVSGGPVGGEPFKVTVPGSPAPAIEVSLVGPFNVGEATAKILSPGGSGRLVLTITNLGDAPVDATSTPVTITDELPEGTEATDVTSVAGYATEVHPVDCEIKASDLVSCTFEETLASYAAIEVEVPVNLIGSPPVAGDPGRVTVSGGNVATASTEQPIKVSPEPTPFGIERFEAPMEEEGGKQTIQAGAHPFQVTNTIQFNAGDQPEGRGGNGVRLPAQPRNLRFPLPQGLVGNATTMAQCTTNEFFSRAHEGRNGCTPETAIGAASLTLNGPSVSGVKHLVVPVFNLAPALGEPARFGFTVVGDPILIDTEVDPDDHYRITASVRNLTQLVSPLASTVVLWGTPGDPRHDAARGWACTEPMPIPEGPCEPVPNLPETAFLRAPVSCDGPLDFDAAIEPWNTPTGSVIDEHSFAATGLHGCNQVPFAPAIAAAPTSKLAANPSGLDFRLEMPNSNLENSEGIAEAQPKKVEVTLPEGVTVNPSQGEGLAGCSPAQFAAEKSNSLSGAGCPEASKIGTVQVQTPLLNEEATGALYVASPHNNPFNSLLGLYLVARIPERGILVKLAGKVDPDPRTGQLTTTFDNLPQLPFSAFKLHFREGGRAPLVTPQACGTFTTEARFVPWSTSNPNNPLPGEVVTRTASFQIERGVDGGACPSGGTPPFKPGLLAGTINNAAGSFSDFNVRLTRNDGEQEFTHFSIKLPPGITGKLAGVPYCPEAGIAQAKARTGIHGGQEELDSPSCPAASQVGRTLVGAGVGSILTYVPGKLYLAGPYNGAPLSMVAITSGVVGPFDIGTVVVRQAFRIDPETAEVFVDATGSDAIPHIIQGIPVHARDIRAYVDRPNFTLNPTSCRRTSTASTVLGSGLNFASEVDDRPITVSSPFQAADCAALPFKPRLSLKLKGGTRRGSFPALTATLKMNGIGEAGIARAQVTLPSSEFIAQSHFNTICTRVQFKAGAHPGEKCPTGSVYGKVIAETPILAEPLTGPVFLRSSEHQLPDVVASLHSGQIDVVLVGRVDSVKGRLRTTFESTPDAPVKRAVFSFMGGKKGLFENSTNLCRSTNKATIAFDGQNGKDWDSNPAVKAIGCSKAKKQKAKRAAAKQKRKAH